ncbi:MAG: serine hydrolase [Methanoregula sp.]|uniref:serine hydrolase n=1 Tax=Methanoregula sp. TaxID=2052170 RepID=UPI0025F727AE|nr:serine hydrolase [Methanoregula sp.]MCK9630769.1 serine hydrolase [Methanoregula sp.]
MKRSLLLVILLAILAAGVCVAGCATSLPAGTSISTSPPNTAQQALSYPTPAEFNGTLATFDTYAEKARQRWNVPGMAVAVVKDGKIIFAKGYGVKTAGGSDPVTTDSVFQIGSTTKAFTAALVAMEVDTGRMNWNDPVIRYVPDFQMKDPWVTKEFTLTDALAQRSGLDEKWGQDLSTLGYSRSEMIHALRYAEPVTSFRSQYRYQNIPFIVAAAAVENTSGKSWEENLKTRIFTPLSMTSASTGYDAFRSEPDHVSLHMIGELPDGSLGPVAADPDWQFNYATDTLGPAGSINANVKDMATWTIFQMGNGTYDGKLLMSPENLAYLHTPQILIPGETTADSKSYYGQGWEYQEMNGTPPIVRHTGETLGNHAYVMFVPRENLGIVVLANEAGPSLPEDVGNAFYRMYFGTFTPDTHAESTDPLKEIKDFLFHPTPVRPEHPVPPLPLESYTGSYTSDVYGQATIAAVNGNLTLTLGKKPVTLYLAPWDGNSFRATCPAWKWGPVYDGRVVFSTHPDGTVRQLTTTLFLQKMFNQDATFIRAGAA